MSKNVISSPVGLLKNSLIGALVALVSYVLLQFLVALLIHGEILGEGMLYLMICVAAALSSFLGCLVSVMRGGDGAVLTASAVTLVFLAVTIVVGVLSGEAGTVSAGLTGVGVAMAFGGLLAAAISALGWRVNRREAGRGKRKKRR